MGPTILKIHKTQENNHPIHTHFRDSKGTSQHAFKENPQAKTQSKASTESSIPSNQQHTSPI